MVTTEQKEVLLLVFQKFADVLSKKLLEYKQQGIDDPLTQWWFYWVWGFFREIARVVSNRDICRTLDTRPDN